MHQDFLMTNNKFLSILFALIAVTAYAEEPYGPAATVNGVEIPRSKVTAQTDHLVNARGMGSGGITQPGTYRQIQEEVVEQLVVQELLWQEAKRRDIQVTDEEVDAAMEQARSGFDDDLAFRFRLEEGGFTEESFRQNIREQKSVQMMLGKLAEDEVVVDDAAVESFYAERINEMVMPGRIRARHILIKFDPENEAERRAADERIAAARDALESGESFALVATEYSEGPSSGKGGDLGYFEKGQMVKAFEEAAFALDVGEVSDVVETEFGYHIIKLEDRVDSRTVPLAEAEPRIRDYLEQQGFRDYVTDLIETLRSEGDVQINLW
jgi:peptidyl-prolyl cis-trans isomerase C